MNELKTKIDDLLLRLEDLKLKLNIPKIKKQIEELEIDSIKEGFWDDSMKASEIMRELSNKGEDLKIIKDLEDRIKDLEELMSVSSKEDIELLEKTIQEEILSLDKKFEEIDSKIREIQSKKGLAKKTTINSFPANTLVFGVPTIERSSLSLSGSNALKV